MARGKAAVEGDTRWSPNGYHYTRLADRWELTHRVTIERALGRPLADDERCRFKEGFSKVTDYDNPDAIEVFKVKSKSGASELAKLYAKRDEIEARIAELEASDS